MAKDKGILLSKKHGVNPSICCCEVCGDEIGIAMLGKLKGDVEAPKRIYQGLCDKCQSVINQNGLLIIETEDGESGNNPKRTGRIVGITEEAKNRMYKDIKSPVCYMEHSLFSQMLDGILKNKESEEKES